MKSEIETLQTYAVQAPIKWPFKDIPLPSESMVQLDTFTEWIQQIQFKQDWIDLCITQDSAISWDDYNNSNQWDKLLLPLTHPDQNSSI